MPDTLSDLDTDSRNEENDNQDAPVNPTGEEIPNIDDSEDQVDPDEIREQADKDTKNSPYEEGETDEGDEEKPDSDEESPEDSEEEEEDGEGESKDDEGDKDDDEEESPEEDATITDLLIDQFGYEELQENEYEDSIDGVMQLARDAAEAGTRQQIDRYKENNPEAGQFLEYLENDGDPAKYIQTVSPQDNYLEIEEIPEENVTMQKKLVRDKLEADGYSEDQIENQLDSFESSGLLHNQAEMALHNLKKNQKEQKQQLLQEQKEEAERVRKQQKEYIDTLQSIVDESSEIAGMPIPEAKKDDFKEFITPDEESGVSPYAAKANDLTQEQVLGIQYLVFNGFDLSSIVNNRAKTQKAENLTEQLRKASNPLSDESKNRERGSRQVDSTEDLSV